MLKALLKKQLLELNTAYFMDRKTGKMRSKKGIIGFTALYAVITVVLINVIAFAVAFVLTKGIIIPKGPIVKIARKI